jgi:hypothetical protein
MIIIILLEYYRVFLRERPVTSGYDSKGLNASRLPDTRIEQKSCADDDTNMGGIESGLMPACDMEIEIVHNMTAQAAINAIAQCTAQYQAIRPGMRRSQGLAQSQN